MNLLELLLVIPLLALSVSFHEYAHGRVAYFLGDPTAKYEGRLSLNPIAHIDPVGSVLLPLLLILAGSSFIFGWAKPVPINPYYFEDSEKGMALVGISGPLANFFLAAMGGLLIRLGIFGGATFLEALLLFFVKINTFLGVFNLVPIPPLDGSRVLAWLLPAKFRYTYYSLERYGTLILLLLILVFGTYLFSLISPIFNFLFKIFAGV